MDTAYLAGRDPALVARQLCNGGADLVQIRAKGASLAEVRELVQAVLPVTQAAGVWCVLNDHAALGCELGVPCVHLGQEDFFEIGNYRSTNELWKGLNNSSPPTLGLSSHAPANPVAAYSTLLTLNAPDNCRNTSEPGSLNLSRFRNPRMASYSLADNPS